jgi:hypothetical protein
MLSAGNVGSGAIVGGVSFNIDLFERCSIARCSRRLILACSCLEFAALSLQVLDLATLAREDMAMLLDPNENMYSFSFHAGACDLLVPHADHTSSSTQWSGRARR